LTQGRGTNSSLFGRTEGRPQERKRGGHPAWGKKGRKGKKKKRIFFFPIAREKN